MASRYRLANLQPLLPPRLSIPVPRVPRVPALPFFRDPQHTAPTRWSLYRPLLRFAKAGSGQHSFPDIEAEIRRLWKKNKRLTSVPQTRDFLVEQYEVLEAFRVGKVPELLELEHRMAENHRLAEERKPAPPPPQKPPRLTGGFLRPTLYNPPLPRMKPQPIKVSTMIHNRLRARERRMIRRKEYASLRTDVKLEAEFWRNMEGLETDWAKPRDERAPGGWDVILREEIEAMDKRFVRENERAAMIFDVEMIERVKRAKARNLKWISEKKQAMKEQKQEKARQETNGDVSNDPL